MTQPDFIIIPTQLLSDKRLQPSDRMLFGYVYWMTKMALMKCVAGNAMLGELTGLSERAISGSLQRLSEYGYVRIIYKDEAKRHRVEIQTLIAYSANNATNEPRLNKRAIQIEQMDSLDRTNVLHNKNTNKEDIKRIEAKASVNSDKPNVTNPKVQAFFYMLVKALGFSETVRFTDGRKRKLSLRLKAYKGSEILVAAQNLGSDAYMQGENEGGKRYGDIDYLLRNDEIVDKYLNKGKIEFTEGAF